MLAVSMDRASTVLEVQGDREAKKVPEPADAKVPTSTTMEWDQTSGGMKGEALGDQTVTSHKALFTKDTHTPRLHPTTPLFTQSPTLPKCHGRDLGDSANSTLRHVGPGDEQESLEHREKEGAQRLRQRGKSDCTVCKTPS